MATYYEHVQSPLVRLEHILHPLCAFLIMPIFALSNTGISFTSDIFAYPNIFMGIFFGLVFGKVLGITLFTFIADKIGLAKKFESVMGAGLLAGIGFTMSIFISVMAFPDPTMENTAKSAVVMASVCSALLGSTFFLLNKPKGSTV
jgi:Na+:H+ antiporter, NhaA family